MNVAVTVAFEFTVTLHVFPEEDAQPVQATVVLAAGVAVKEIEVPAAIFVCVQVELQLLTVPPEIVPVPVPALVTVKV